MITSRQNPRIKAACALRDRSHREQRSQAIVYGVRESARALQAGGRVVECLWCREYFRAEEAEQVVRQLEAAGADLLELSADAFDKLAYGDRLDGVVSVFESHFRGLNDLSLPNAPLIAVVEGVEKPGNLGAILRTADGAGADAVVVADPVIDLFNPNAIRASVAAVFQPNVVTATTDETMAWLRNHHLAMWAAFPDAETNYWDVDYTAGGAVVLGSESKGLTDAWSAEDVQRLSLPMLGVADSLNVSVTAAVLLYESRKQRMY